MRTIFLPALLVMLLQGCGHTGNLYLPEPQQKPAAVTPTSPQPAAAEEKNP